MGGTGRRVIVIGAVIYTTFRLVRLMFKLADWIIKTLGSF